MNYEIIEKIKDSPLLLTNLCGMPLFYVNGPGNLQFTNIPFSKDLAMQKVASSPHFSHYRNVCGDKLPRVDPTSNIRSISSEVKRKHFFSLERNNS